MVSVIGWNWTPMVETQKLYLKGCLVKVCHLIIQFGTYKRANETQFVAINQAPFQLGNTKRFMIT